MPYELLSYEDPIDIRAIADVQQHIGNASGRRLFESGEYAPYSIHLFFHLFFLNADIVPFFLSGIFSKKAFTMAVRTRGCQTHVPELVYHVAFWMPMLVLTISEYLDELLEDGGLTPIASLSKSGGVMVVAVDFPFVLVVAVLSAKDCRAYRTGEMLNVVFPLQCCDVGSTQGATAFVTE